MLEFSINGQIITRNDEDPIVRDSQNYVIAYFLGDEEWRSHGTVTAIFKGADGQIFNMILSYDSHYGHSCLVPWEVLTQPWFEVSAFCGNLITANTVKVFTIKSGYDSTRDSRIPTPDVYNQIIEQLNRIEDEVDPDAVKAFVDEYLEGKDFVTESDVETIVETYISEHQSQLKTSVTVTPILTSGTKIAEIDVDGTTEEIFAPEGGGGASSLSSLSDTSISSPQNGDVLVFDGEKWENNVIEGLEHENKFDSLSFTPLAKVIDKNSGNLVDASNGQSLVISNPTEGDVYRITGAYFGTGALYCFYYQDHTKTIYPATNTGKLGYLPIIETITLTIPANVEELRISSRNYDLKVEKQTNDIVYKIPEKHNDNVLYGKKWAVCGDSYTVGNFEGYVDSEGHTGEDSDAFDKKQMRYKTYPWWIGNRNNMKVQWLAYGGKDFTNISGAYYPFSDSESDRTYYNYTMIDPDCDYVTLMFGLNEANLTTEQIGTSADTTNETLWGAYYVVLSAIFIANPTVKIGIIIEDSYMNETYATALKAIAKYWGIPCLDIKGDENVSMMLGGKFYTHSSVAENIKNDAFRVSANNSHPNVKGHEYRSTVIENFLRTL